MIRYGSISTFTFDLTWEQRRLCVWVAEQSSSGVERIYYDDMKAILGIERDRDVTRLLREIRERYDNVHEMVQFPIVNTSSPYFEIHMNADYIWDDYCRAEREIMGSNFEDQLNDLAISHRSEYGCAACSV